MNVATIDRTPTVTAPQESLSHLRHLITLTQVQAREGKIKWQGDDGVIRTGRLWRGVRAANYTVIPGADPRGHLVLVTDLDKVDHLIAFDHLVSLYDQGLLQVR